MDGTRPSIIYCDGKGINTDFSTRPNLVYIEITDSSNKTYSVDEPLKTGEYKVNAFYRQTNATSETVSFSVKASNPVVAKEGQGYVKPQSFTGLELSSLDGVGALGTNKLKSLGEQKVLVIPVGFADTTQFTAKEIKTIQSAYFGKSEETGFESLASYYYKSSYGKMTITGEVTPEYRVLETCESFASTNNDPEKIIAGALAQIAKDGKIDLKNYDGDSDGYIDAIELSYKTTQPLRDGTNPEAKPLWWNFTSKTDSQPNKDVPAGCRYFWSVYSYIATGYYETDIDAHTIIHETGHMLGLNDYYSYDYASSPAGRVDMMDNNVGDHNAYSKMMLGWTTPKYLDGSLTDLTITLDSFEDSGDCLIFRDYKDDPWNKTPYDEYVLLQYYTPTNLAKADSNGYGEYSQYGPSITGHGGTYEKAGLQAFHVDNRLMAKKGKIVDGTIREASFYYEDRPTNEAIITGDSYRSNTIQISNNTPSYSQRIVDGSSVNPKDGTNNYELEILPGDGSNSFLGPNDKNFKRMGYNYNLFGTGAYSCGSSAYNNSKMKSLFWNNNGYAFNDGSLNPWSFEVVEQTDSNITLHFVSTLA